MTGRRAEWRYALLVLLFWLPTGLYLATKILLMLDRGLSVAAIGTVVLIFSLTTAALELPTGGLADVIGRRTVLAASAVASCAGLALLAVADGFWLFAASAVLRGIARALSSGPDEAWFVDTMHAVEGPDAPLTRGLARGEAAGSVGLGIGTLLGGALPLALGAAFGLSALAVPVAIAALVELVRLLVTVFGMPEPPRPRTSVGAVLRGVPATVAAGLRLGLRDGVLARLLLAGAGVGVALSAIELLTPGWLADLVGDPERGASTYAVVAAAGFGASAVGSLLGPWAQRRLGSAVRAGVAGIALGAAALVAVALAGPTLREATIGVPVIAAAYLLLFVGLGVTAAPQAALLHARVAPTERATVISVQSLALQAAGALGSVGSGALATARGPALAFGTAGAALVAAAWVVARIQVTDPAPEPLREPAAAL
ncbi:Major Facilitator Superfamily protein [Asanoa hainanensis]|uniref:Major Facilitator Superfamily protein n=1 Tax=Asanoa hainanensis TaxID=560556 RepID=A0A239L601_9ACTN|nr:MFS transporter [Asanoa hainanensis]SNT25099.1 Major Facilitator Superfamily protein [Asanoa hainanensis]